VDLAGGVARSRCRLGVIETPSSDGMTAQRLIAQTDRSRLT
jgi:hypothetical protein